MIRYECDWCKAEKPLNCVSTIEAGNVYSEHPMILHICRECAMAHMPEKFQPMASWTGQ